MSRRNIIIYIPRLRCWIYIRKKKNKKKIERKLQRIELEWDFTEQFRIIVTKVKFENCVEIKRKIIQQVFLCKNIVLWIVILPLHTILSTSNNPPIHPQKHYRGWNGDLWLSVICFLIIIFFAILQNDKSHQIYVKFLLFCCCFSIV